MKKESIDILRKKLHAPKHIRDSEIIAVTEGSWMRRKLEIVELSEKISDFLQRFKNRPALDHELEEQKDNLNP